MKNLETIYANIKEAKEELEKILSDISARGSGYSKTEFKIALEHACHHLNFSWNIRNEDSDRVKECSDHDFKKWSRYPNGEILEYE